MIEIGLNLATAKLNSLIAIPHDEHVAISIFVPNPILVPLNRDAPDCYIVDRHKLNSYTGRDGRAPEPAAELIPEIELVGIQTSLRDLDVASTPTIEPSLATPSSMLPPSVLRKAATVLTAE
jgi:hypothetical protein